MIKKIDRIIYGITKIFSIFAYICLVGIMLLITVDVILRKVFSSPILGSYELVERMLLILVFAGFGYCQTYKGHIKVTMFIGRMPDSVSLTLSGILGILSGVTAGICGYAMVLQALDSASRNTWTPVLHIPLAPFFWIAAVGTFVFALVLLWDAVKNFFALGNQELAEELKSAWD